MNGVRLKLKRNNPNIVPEYKTETGLLSSNDWRTPKPLFDKFNAEFNFKWDLAADNDNHLLPYYCTKEVDALWDNFIWLANGYANIPYSKPRGWYEKARQSAIDYDTLTVLLVKVATSENYWTETVKDAHVRFLAGRIKFWDQFGKPHYGATFGNALIIFAPYTIGNHNSSTWNYRLDKPEKMF